MTDVLNRQKINGKKVLFIAPSFFGYEKDIAQYLTELGADLDVLLDRPFDSPFMTMMTRVARPLVAEAATLLYQRILHKKGRSSYDLIFIISGQTVSNAMLRELKSNFPRAKFILYMYDSFGNRGSTLKNLPLFDECFTFDCNDAKKYNLNFRPLFFSKGFERKPSLEFQYHLSFIGTAHTDRFEIISKISKHVGSDKHCYWYLFLQAPWVYYIYKTSKKEFSNAQYSDFKYKSLSKKEVQNIFFKSLAVVDVEHPKQTGLTIRTFETIGASKKLITTNHRVVDYDFYDPNNICVINRTAPKIPKDFLESNYNALSSQIYEKYRMSGWLTEILENFD